MLQRGRRRSEAATFDGDRYAPRHRADRAQSGPTPLRARAGSRGFASRRRDDDGAWAARMKGDRQGRRDRLGSRFVARSLLLVASREERRDRRSCRGQRAEVSAVEGVLGLPVHQEHLAARDARCSLAKPAAAGRDGPGPARRRSCSPSTLMRAAGATNASARQAPRHASAAARRAAGSHARRESTTSGSGGRTTTTSSTCRRRSGCTRVESDRHAGAGVPDQRAATSWGSANCDRMPSDAK